MKRPSKQLAAAILGTAFLIIGCNKNEKEAAVIRVTDVTVSPGSKELTVGETVSLKATISPDNASNKGITWTTSDQRVVSVNQSGLATALKAGNARISATTTDGNRQAFCQITVKEPFVETTGISLSKSTATIYMGGEDLKLEAMVEPADADIKTVIWESSAPGVATVSEGTVHAVSVGKANITAFTAGKKYSETCVVTVEDTPIESVIIDGASDAPIEVEINTEKQLTATVLPANATNKAVSWISSAAETASVNANGLVSFRQRGSVVITAMSDRDNSKKASQSFVVTNPKGYIKINGGEQIAYEEGALSEALAGQTVTSIEFVRGRLTTEDIKAVRALSLNNIIVTGTNENFKGSADNKQLLSQDGKTLLAYATASITGPDFTVPSVQVIEADIFGTIDSRVTGVLTIPASVTTIRSGNFTGGGFAELHLIPTTPPSITAGIFADCPNMNTVYVPASAVNSYKTIFGAFADKIKEMPADGGSGGAGNGGNIGDGGGQSGTGGSGEAGGGGTIGDDQGNPQSGTGGCGEAGFGGSIGDNGE